MNLFELGRTMKLEGEGEGRGVKNEKVKLYVSTHFTKELYL